MWYVKICGRKDPTYWNVNLRVILEVSQITWLVCFVAGHKVKNDRYKEWILSGIYSYMYGIVIISDW